MHAFLSECTIGKFDTNVLAVTPDRKEKCPQIGFVHGLGGHAGQFEQYLLYCRGAGVSAWALTHKERSFMGRVQELHEVLNLMGPTILVGHSLGALAVRSLGETSYTENLCGAVYLNMTPPAEFFLPLEIQLAMGAYMKSFLWGTPFRFTDAHLKKYFLNDTLQESASLENVRAFGKYFQEESAKPFREMAFHQIILRSGTIYTPELLIGTREDKIVPPELIGKIAEKFSLDVCMFPGDHMHMLTRTSALGHIIEWAKLAQPLAALQ